MTRNLKALGLAVMAACAMSAMLAATAQATPGTIEADVGADEATVTGTQVGHHKFETGVGEITCENTTFDGTVKDGDHELTITPTYETCTTIDPFGTKRTTTITMTSCDYRFTEGNATSGNANHFEGITVALKCNAGDAIHIKVYNGTTHNVGHDPTNRRCEYTVFPFSHKLHNTVQNVGSPPDHLTVVSEVTDIAVTRTFGTFLQCGAANQSSDYIGHTTLKAYSDTAHTTQVDLTLTDVG